MFYLNPVDVKLCNYVWPRVRYIIQPSSISEILVLACTRENGNTQFSTYTWNHIFLGNWGTYLSFQQGIIAT